MELNKIDGISMNIEQTEMQKLKSVFPQCFAEGKLDIEVMIMKVLIMSVTAGNGRYSTAQAMIEEFDKNGFE